MDALVIVVIGVSGAWLALFASYLRAERANDRLKWLLDRQESDLTAAKEQAVVLRKLVAELTRQNAALEERFVKQHTLATRSQQSSQEMQPEAPEIVRTLPVAAGRLAQYVKEQAMASGRQLSDYEAEQMAASMLVESGI